MKKIEYSQRLAGLSPEDRYIKIPGWPRKDSYDSDKSFCGNSELLYSTVTYGKERNISPSEYKKQRVFIKDLCNHQ